MNLTEALDLAASHLYVRGISDRGLAATVASRAKAGSAALSPVPDLHGDRRIRPADVLLRLATATLPQDQTDLHDVQAFWALFRYLGVFAATGSERMALSEAGQRVVGNQRRVMSEELGIGFAVYLAASWMDTQRLGRCTTRTLDIDAAVVDGYVDAGDARLRLLREGPRRTDYLVIAESIGDPGRFRIALLECKGTKTRSYAYQQLADAAEQLNGMVVGDRKPRGLAASAVVADGSITYLALEHAPESSTMPGVGAPEVGLDLEVRLDPEAIVEPLDRDGAALARMALRGSWAALADFAGNEDAFEQWATPGIRTRFNRRLYDRPARTRIRADDVDVVGASNVIPVPGGRLEIVLGVEAGVDEALTSGEPDQVRAAQAQVVERRLRYTAAERRTSAVVSVADDGSAMVLRPL
jgi:hypothetical protein